MREVATGSVDLIVTSPPYPMIEMWDDTFASQLPLFSQLLDASPQEAFAMAHSLLDGVWRECFRVLKEGAFLCINIGDATRTLGGQFELYNNHARIIEACLAMGLHMLPSIIWRKPTNAPNKFMGSGMLPCGAYITLEHEWILIFRKGGRRAYTSAEARSERMRSAFFWEERNVWFSDIWEIVGAKQTLREKASRSRSGAYPLEIPFRLINMFSQRGDLVLDPFAGTGTTALAAMIAGRHSVSYEIASDFALMMQQRIRLHGVSECNDRIKQRLDQHSAFIADREQKGKTVKHFNRELGTPVMTAQEAELELHCLTSISEGDSGLSFVADYQPLTSSHPLPLVVGDLFSFAV